jgi:hypothetical protein
MFRVNLLVPEEISGRDVRVLTVSGASESLSGFANRAAGIEASGPRVDVA